jgi:CubicO group peptidase (beta-lactamase class C family)
MRLKNIISIVCIAFFLFQVSSLSGQKINSFQIDSIVHASMDMMTHAGVAVAVIQDGKVIHSKGYGIASLSSGEKVDENTLFAIASNSKSFTAAALAILVDEGKLDWNDKVIDYIPEFKMYDNYVTENFNIIDLLTHRSGLGLGAGDLLFFPDGSDFGISDVLNSFQYQKPTSAFRTKYDYDNLLYVVAGEVISRISGMTWAEFVELRIMIPLEMNRSAGVFQNLKDKSNLAIPHSTANGKIKELRTYLKNDGSLGAAGGIYSSVKDMSNWLLVQLNEGKYGTESTKQLFSAKSQHMMWKPHTNINFDFKPKDTYKSHFRAYGLGWNISDKNGYITMEHTGGLPGMLSSTLVIPELNSAVVVLTNADPGGYSFWSIRAEITDLLLGVERKDWISSMKSRIENSESKGDSVVNAVWAIASKTKTNHLDLNNFVGLYKDDWFGNVDISLKDGKLWFSSQRSPKLSGQMYFYQANTFAVKWIYQDMPCDAFAMFNLDENGKSLGIKMKGISPNIDFSFDFQDLDLRRIPE